MRRFSRSETWATSGTLLLLAALAAPLACGEEHGSEGADAGLCNQPGVSCDGFNPSLTRDGAPKNSKLAGADGAPRVGGTGGRAASVVDGSPFRSVDGAARPDAGPTPGGSGGKGGIGGSGGTPVLVAMDGNIRQDAGLDDAGL